MCPEGGSMCPEGFTAAGMACGVKASGKLDLALIRCEPAAQAAAIFTRNVFCAAPIDVSRRHLVSSG
jgi:glutamate N-acetyltransferase/amino-acid N-acetyltransferase